MHLRHYYPRGSSPMNAREAQVRKVIGTAGHIDHGKTSLVRALTGRDPDRLPEERRRGMTLDQARDINVVPYGSRFLAASIDKTTGIALEDNFFR